MRRIHREPDQNTPVWTGAKTRSFRFRLFATGSDRYPVTIFKEFLSLRPSEIRTTSRLYLSCVSNPSSQVWYKRQPMSEQAHRHDEGRNQRNDHARFMENLFQPERQENSSKEAENIRPRAKFNRKSNVPPKREVTG